MNTRPGVLNSEGGEFPLNRAYPYSKSVGNDESQHGFGNPRITIDFGKSANAITVCAAICGICLAVTVVTVWHSKEREVETQARIRVLQNHIDENTALLRVLEKDHATGR